MQIISWKAAHALDGRNGNRWAIKPTRDMALGFECVKCHAWRIKGELTTFEVTYDRDYAIAYTRHHLSFVSHLPEDIRNEFIRDVVTKTAPNDLSESKEAV